MTRICPRPGCEMATTGVCMEGFNPVEQCPYTHVAADDDEAQSHEQDDEGEYVRVSTGDALTLEQANAVSGARPSRLIVLAGAAGSGKTTLLTSIYEKFLEASFAGFNFAGSETLVGFERRCYLGRTYSRQTVAETSRTPAKREPRVLHLRLSRGEQAMVPDLLLVDVSGEQFRMARDTDRGAQALGFMRRADSFALLIDGAKLAEYRLRTSAYHDARSILRSLIENEMVGEDLDVEVLFTKWDVLGPATHRAGNDFLEHVQAQMSAEFRSHQVSFAPIAARPEHDPALPFAHGLGELLARWCSPLRSKTRRPILLASTLSEDSRQLMRFGARQLRQGLGYDLRTI